LSGCLQANPKAGEVPTNGIIRHDDPVAIHRIAAAVLQGVVGFKADPLQKTHRTGEKLAISWSCLLGVG
jgi:hypothetical protein